MNLPAAVPDLEFRSNDVSRRSEYRPLCPAGPTPVSPPASSVRPAGSTSESIVWSWPSSSCAIMPEGAGPVPSGSPRLRPPRRPRRREGNSARIRSHSAAIAGASERIAPSSSQPSGLSVFARSSSRFRSSGVRARRPIRWQHVVMSLPQARRLGCPNRGDQQRPVVDVLRCRRGRRRWRRSCCCSTLVGRARPGTRGALRPARRWFGASHDGLARHVVPVEAQVRMGMFERLHDLRIERLAAHRQARRRPEHVQHAACAAIRSKAGPRA